MSGLSTREPRIIGESQPRPTELNQWCVLYGKASRFGNLPIQVKSSQPSHLGKSRRSTDAGLDSVALCDSTGFELRRTLRKEAVALKRDRVERPESYDHSTSPAAGDTASSYSPRESLLRTCVLRIMEFNIKREREGHISILTLDPGHVAASLCCK